MTPGCQKTRGCSAGGASADDDDIDWSGQRQIALSLQQNCDNSSLRILHAIHDFLPRHRAGSEIYTFELCRALAAAHQVTVVCADYDPARPHGHVTWRVHDGVPVVEIVNNWICESFESTYRPPLIADRLEHVLRAVQPDVLHVHNLLNLSFDLPRLAVDRGIPVVATLHDYTLVCASGGQRFHRAENHVCRDVDTDRCVRCFRESPFSAQLSFGRLASSMPSATLMGRAARAVSRRIPLLTSAFVRAARHASSSSVTRTDIDARLAAAQAVFHDIDLFVAPSRALATEFVRLGVPAEKIRTSDYGFVPLQPTRTTRRPGPSGPDTIGVPIRIGYVGTLVWHKGVHVLVDAVQALPDNAFELKIYGDPSVFPDYSSELRARAGDKPVHFAGAFDRTDLESIYTEIDVLVVPSLWMENSPLVIHEAFMSGVPVVGARSGGIADLIDDGRSGGWLYDPESTVQLSALLLSLVENPERITAMASQLPSVKTVDDDAREWCAVYDECSRRDVAAEHVS